MNTGELPRLVPPTGWRIHTRPILPVSCGWQEILRKIHGAINPDCEIMRAEMHFPPDDALAHERELVLLNYKGRRNEGGVERDGRNQPAEDGRGSWEVAQAWAGDTGLPNSSPFDVFALAAQCPHLDEVLEMSTLYLTATGTHKIHGSERSCYVTWDSGKRIAGMNFINKYVGGCRVWFVFRR